MADMLYGAAGGGGDIVDDHANDFYGAAAGGAGLPNVGGFAPNPGAMVGAGIYNNSGQPPRPRYPGLYVGNLTWWTTDRDVIDAINSVGVNDVQEVKFFENRNNGQSKGFCVVTFISDASLPIVMEKLPQKELHGQNPVVTPYNRQNLSLFESQNKMIRPQMNSTNGPPLHAAGMMGINPMTGVHPAASVAANPQLATAVANIPYASVATAGTGTVGLGYSQAALNLNSLGTVGSAGGPQPRAPYMGMRMRGPRPMMSGGMNNGPMMSGGHQMNRMGFIPRPRWNNTQGIGGGGGYQGANRLGPSTNMDISSRQGGYGSSGGGPGKQDDLGGSDLQGAHSSYYNSHHSNSQSDHYNSRSDIRDHRDHHHRDQRDDRDIRRLDDRPSRLDDRTSRLDDRSSRLDERSSRLDERSSRHDDRLSSRDHDRSSRPLDDRSDRSRRSPVDLHRSSARKFVDDERGASSRRGGVIGSEDRRDRDRDDKSVRREDKSGGSSSSRHHRERSHRSDDRGRSRSRSKERSVRAEGGRGGERRDRDRDSRKERY